MASIKLNGDVSGEITISAPSVAGTHTLTLPSTSETLATQNSLGVRNLIINGDMRIDQRNAGASYTPVFGNTNYGLDRWRASVQQSSKFSIQQNAGSITPPAGFTNYLGCTSLSAYTVGASENFDVRQIIEGFNVADLGWGTANAKTVTLSFWVRSSLTGMFGGTLRNSNVSRSYPYSYTISSANTWEYKTITIAGDTAGTWLTNNGNGIGIVWSLGAGSSVSGTAGAWVSSNLNSVTGATSVVGTNGATFYITGVQLEVGTEATPFEHRPYDMELQRCERYYQKSYNMSETAGTISTAGYEVFQIDDGAIQRDGLRYRVRMRQSGSINIYNPATGTSGQIRTNSGNNYSVSLFAGGDTGLFTSCTPAAGEFLYFHWTADSEL